MEGGLHEHADGVVGIGAETHVGRILHQIEIKRKAKDVFAIQLLLVNFDGAMTTMSHATINEHFTQDHDRLDELFLQYRQLKATDRGQAARSFQEFKAGLEQHIIWEEEILFPSFERTTGHTGGPTEVMRWEHREIRSILDAMATKLASADFATEAEEAGLLAVLEPHNFKEESVLYPMIDQVTGAQERSEIFTRMGQHAKPN